MKKQTKRIIACFSVVVVLVILLAIPSFAYYESNNTSIGQRAYMVSLPMQLSRGTLTCLDVDRVNDNDKIILFDLPTEININTAIDTTQKNEYSINDNEKCVTHTAYSTTNNYGIISANLFGNSVSNSNEQRLDLYGNGGYLLKSSFGDTENYKFTVYAMESVSRMRITFDILYPEIAKTDHANYFQTYYSLIPCTYDLEPISVSSQGGYTYTLFTENMFNNETIGNAFEYQDVDTSYYSEGVFISNVRISCVGTRGYNTESGYDPNYDFSFAIGSECVNSSDSGIANITEHDFYLPFVYDNVSFDDISVVDWAITQINSILALELIPYVSIGAIIWFVVGLSLFFFILKMFLGG